MASSVENGLEVGVPLLEALGLRLHFAIKCMSRVFGLLFEGSRAAVPGATEIAVVGVGSGGGDVGHVVPGKAEKMGGGVNY